MKKILLSLGSIVFTVAAVAGATGAHFYGGDPNSSSGNTFANGIIELKVDNESYVTSTSTGSLIFSTTTSWGLDELAGHLFFKFSDLKPGDIGEDTISLHIKENTAWACMNIKLTATPENGQPEPEAAVDPTAGVNDGELQNNLYFTFWADDGDNVLEANEVAKIFKQGLVKDIFTGQNWPLADSQTNVWGSSGPLEQSKTKYIGKAWCFGTLTQAPKVQDGLGKTTNGPGGKPTNGPLQRGTGFTCSGADVGNALQSDGIKADVSFSVAQSRSNSSYKCEPGSPVPPPQSSATLMSDNFNGFDDYETIDNSKWDQSGGVVADEHSSPHHEVAYFDAGTNASPPNHTEILTSTNFSTLNYHDIVLKYDRNMDVPGGTTASLKVEYSVNGGGSWVAPPLETVTVDHDWVTKTWSLSPSANNKAQVKIKFTFTGTNGTDHAYIDNVSVTGITP